MFCQECGKEIPNDSLFCQECGVRQEEDVKIEKRNKIFAAVVGGALVLCLIIGVASVFIKPTINLNNYLSVTFEGYDTAGKAVVTFDSQKFEEDYARKLSAKTGAASSSAFLSSCVDGSVDRDRGLCNGDIVTYTWSCNDKYALETYGYKLKYKNMEYIVANLEEAETFDPFEGIQVMFDGISPNGTASILGEPTAVAAQNLMYDIDMYNGLKNGDTVTVSISYYEDPIEYCISNYGMIPSSLEKTYTVEGLDSYIRGINDVSEDSFKEMQAQAEDVYNANIAQSWGDDEKLKSFTYIGSYLLTNKSSDQYWGTSDNILYLVYKAQVDNEYSNEEAAYSATNDIYWYIAYYDLLVNPDGVTTVNITDYSTPGDGFYIDTGISSGWWNTKSWYYYGYQTIDELYKAVVTSNVETYNHEDNVGDSISVTEIAGQDEKIVGEEGIIFPNSSEELLSEKDVEELSDEELRYAINELYARCGYIFKDDTLRAYYEQFDWYEQEIEPDDFSMDFFNDVEKQNAELLQKERDSRN